MFSEPDILECYLQTIADFRIRRLGRDVHGEQLHIPRRRERNHSSDGWNLSNRRREALTQAIRKYLDGKRRARDKTRYLESELETLSVMRLRPRSYEYQRRYYLQRALSRLDHNRANPYGKRML